MTQEILTRIDKYQALLDRKDELADLTKANNEEMAAAREELANLMINAEVDAVERNGVNWRVTAVTRYSKRGGMDDELFEQLRAHGLGSLIRETVNAQTLQGAMSEQAELNGGELPPEFAGCISVYEYNDISRRKVARRK
jgi:hypothetical protein